MDYIKTLPLPPPRCRSAPHQLPPASAVCICNERTVEAISEGWGIIALSIWGHGENKFDDADFAKLDEPELEVPLSEDQVANLIAYADGDESVKSIEDLVGVFLIFEADALGFHV